MNKQLRLGRGFLLYVTLLQKVNFSLVIYMKTIILQVLCFYFLVYTLDG
jgi:hypothetical protein